MNRRNWRTRFFCTTAIVFTVLVAACASGGAHPSTGTAPAQQGAVGAKPPAWIAKMDSGRTRISPADVEFMQGMIHHHAQAILMAGWAPTHEASSAIRELCARIVVAQRDEIGFMQRWLREHNQDVPDADVSHFMMPGMESMLIPGMLTAKQLALLDQLARGNGLSSDRIAATRDALDKAEKAAGEQRRSALAQLAAQIDGYSSSASDATRVRALAAVVKELGGGR